jgi:hypothetical protein
MAAAGPAERSHEALQAANERLQVANDRRTLAASTRNRKLAAAALLRLGAECPPEWEVVATEVILHSQYPWSEIARRLGLSRGQAVHRFRQLLIAAGVPDSAAPSREVADITW